MPASQSVVTTLELNPNTSVNVTIGTPVEVTVKTNATDFTVESSVMENATVSKGEDKFTIEGLKAGESIITVKATADGGDEETATITANVSEPVAVVTKPDAPVLTDSGTKEVNEGNELVIAFNNVEDVTLTATVEGGASNGTVVVEGFNVKYTAPAVDSDKDVTIHVIANKDSETSDPTDVVVSVKDVPVVPQKPATPELVEGQTLELNENDTIEIKITKEADATLEAEVEGDVGLAEYREGDTNTEGIITYVAPDNVDADTPVNIVVKANKGGVISDELTVQVTVKNLVKEEITLSVAPERVEVKQTEKAEVIVTTNADSFTFELDSTGFYSAEQKGNKIEVLGIGLGQAELTVKVDNGEGGFVTKTVSISVIDADAVETTLVVTPQDVVSLKEGDTQVFSVETNGVITSIVSDKPEICSVDVDSKTITAVKEGSAVITFTAKADSAAEKSVSVTINVAKIPEVVEPEVEPKYTDEEIDNILDKPDFDYAKDIVEIGKNAPLKYTTQLATVKSYVNKMDITGNLISYEEMAGQAYDLYYVVTDILDDVKEDEAKFDNLLNIISKMFFQYKDIATSKEYLVRGIDLWSKLGYTDDSKDVYTFKALFGLIALLSDETNRDANKATVNFDEVFAEDKVNLDSVFIAALKKFYQF